jgi:hypothetical protein
METGKLSARLTARSIAKIANIAMSANLGLGN